MKSRQLQVLTKKSPLRVQQVSNALQVKNENKNGAKKARALQTSTHLQHNQFTEYEFNCGFIHL